MTTAPILTLPNSELRRTVELLARDPGLRRRMAEAGRRAVVGRSWETICDQLIAHYAKVVARSSLLSERRITAEAVASSAPRVRKVS